MLKRITSIGIALYAVRRRGSEVQRPSVYEVGQLSRLMKVRPPHAVNLLIVHDHVLRGSGSTVNGDRLSEPHALQKRGTREYSDLREATKCTHKKLFLIVIDC